MYVPVEDWHIEELAVTMQEEDKLSIQELSGLSPKNGLIDSVTHSLEAQTWIVDNKVAAISGISQLTPFSDWACPWLLCAPYIRHVPRMFLEQTRLQTYDWLKTYGILRNFVWVEHKRSIKWLKWLGFTIYPAKPIGVNGAMFHMNELVR